MSSNNDPVLILMSQRNSDDHPGMTFSDQKTFANKGPVLSFHNIYYEKTKRSFLFHQKTIEEKMLWNINGIMNPGLNAIMGHSGGDQSLLLDILAARKDPNGLSGDVWIHEVPHAADFQFNSGYVVQDDVVMSSLTMRENLQFSAALRLPTTMTSQEKNERINKIIEDLDLGEVADSKVVSKGERKRTSIGMELIPDPSIIFLDEPTVDLDWRTAHVVFRLLKRISKQERTIIFSINQPEYSIFKLFDSLTLLASGKLIYHGPAQEALGYFTSAGYHCDPHNNPAEFFLGVIHGIFSRELEDHEASKTEVTWKRKTLVEIYANSSFYKDTKAKLDQLSKDQNKRCLVNSEITYVTSFLHQLIGLTRRSFQSLVGHPQHWVVQIIATFIRGLVVGATFLWLKNDCTEIQIRAGVLFFLMAHQCFNSMLTMDLFVVQKKLFIHEYISGYYRMSSYFFGTLLSDLLPWRFLPSFIFTFTLYFMVKSKPTVETFFTMIFTLMMVAFSSISMTLAITVGHSDINAGRRIMGMYFTIMMIFSGLPLYFGTMKPQLSWLQYFSIPYYGFTALQHSEFLGGIFCPALGKTHSNNCPNYVICSGEEFLMMQDIDLSPWGLWKNHVALATLMIIFFIIAYQRLLFLKKHS